MPEGGDNMPEPRSDDALRSAVLEELAWDSLIDESQLGVDVRDGVVTIVGTVESYAERLAARAAAQAVDGVHDLVNEIDVKPLASTLADDAKLAHMVSQVLAWDALVPEQQLTVAVSEVTPGDVHRSITGALTLAGITQSQLEKRAILGAVTQAPGIEIVCDELRIAPEG